MDSNSTNKNKWDDGIALMATNSSNDKYEPNKVKNVLNILAANNDFALVVDSGAQIHIVPIEEVNAFAEFRHKPSKINVKAIGGSIAKTLGKLQLKGSDDVILMAGGAGVLSLYKIVCNGWRFAFDDETTAYVQHRSTGERIDLEIVDGLPIVSPQFAKRLLQNNTKYKVSTDDAYAHLHNLLAQFQNAKAPERQSTTLLDKNQIYFSALLE